MKVFRDDDSGVLYHVIFHDRVLQVPESALEAMRVKEEEQSNAESH